MERGLNLNQILFLGLLGWAGIRGWAPLWVIIVIACWYFSLVYLELNGTLDKWNATRVLGIILMLRTGRGKVALEQFSRPRKFWRIYGEISIWLCFIVMFGVILMIVAAAFATALAPAEQEVLPASDLLLIPGVTSFVPFWWPIIALIFALVIHEYSHGIQARAHGMEVRSFGLLVAGPIPVGAFAEPEQMDMVLAPRRERMRLFAAGPSINLVATFVFLIVIGFLSSGFVATNPGVHALAVIDEGGADEAGIKSYDIITHVDGNEVTDYDSFSSQMDSLEAGDEVIFTIIPYNDEERIWGESSDVLVTLGDKAQYYLNLCDNDQECLDRTADLLESYGIGEGEAFLGVNSPRSGTYQTDRFSFIFEERYTLDQKALTLLLTPLSIMGTPMSYDGQTMDLHERGMIEIDDGFILSSLGTDNLLHLFDFIFWLIWVNFLLGFLNLLPIIPFDGGHMLKDGAHSVLSRIMKGSNPLRVERIAGSIGGMTTVVMLIIVLIPIMMLIV